MANVVLDRGGNGVTKHIQLGANEIDKFVTSVGPSGKISVCCWPCVCCCHDLILVEVVVDR